MNDYTAVVLASLIVLIFLLAIFVLTLKKALEIERKLKS